MSNVNINLYFNNESTETITTFSFEDHKAKFISGVEIDSHTKTSINLSMNDLEFILPEDISTIELYLNSPEVNLASIASEIGATICLKKEYWLFDEAAITESWLMQGDIQMLKRNTKTDFFNIIRDSQSMAN